MISVIIPVYNTAVFLDRCIMSVVSQDYSDLEIILIDDCSTDGSSNILDNWKEKDNRIKVVHKEHNSGVSDSRNIGLKLATGDYIGFVDSDDWIEPRLYSALYQYIVEARADVSFGGYDVVIKNGHEQVLPGGKDNQVFLGLDTLAAIMPQMDTGRQNLYIWNKLYKKAVIDNKNIIFDSSLKYAEDIAWLIDVLSDSNRVVCCHNCDYHYNAERDENTWTAMKEGKRIDLCQNALEGNITIWKILKNKSSRFENNAMQRVLYYQRFAFRTAAKLDNLTAYKLYRKGYYSRLLYWYSHNRTITGLRWLVRQLGADAKFQGQRLNKKVGKE